MTEDGFWDVSEWFWNIIAQANRERERLESILQTMSKSQVERFEEEFRRAYLRLYDDDYIEHMGEIGSEDTIIDIGSWIVSQGKQEYYEILQNPEKMPSLGQIEMEDSFYGVAATVYWERFNEDLIIRF